MFSGHVRIFGRIVNYLIQTERFDIRDLEVLQIVSLECLLRMVLVNGGGTLAKALKARQRASVRGCAVPLTSTVQHCHLSFVADSAMHFT